MTRLFGATIALLAIANSASASLDRPKPLATLTDLRFTVKSLPAVTAAVPPPPQAELNGETQVFLNGRRSEYKEIPPTAAVDRVVLAADGKTILRIEFSTGK